MKAKTAIRIDDIYLHLEYALEVGLVVEPDRKLPYEAGFSVPVVYSRACHMRHIEWNGPDRSQDRAGREWDVLMLSAIALRCNENEAGQAETGILSVPPGGSLPERDDLRIAWLLDEMDNPVVLVMLATETVCGIDFSSQFLLMSAPTTTPSNDQEAS